MSELTFNAASDYFLYRGNTGELINKARDRGLFKNNQSYASWNSRCFNKPVSKTDGNGYIVASIFNKFFGAHRVCWLLYYGELPKGQIDHINGIRTDNRIENLRDVTIQENLKNKRMSKNNKSGFNGVSWFEPLNKWRAQISVKGKRIHLGCFAALSDAIDCRKAANIKYEYHKNHGEALKLDNIT